MHSDSKQLARRWSLPRQEKRRYRLVSAYNCMSGRSNGDISFADYVETVRRRDAVMKR